MPLATLECLCFALNQTDDEQHGFLAESMVREARAALSPGHSAGTFAQSGGRSSVPWVRTDDFLTVAALVFWAP